MYNIRVSHMSYEMQQEELMDLTSNQGIGMEA